MRRSASLLVLACSCRPTEAAGLRLVNASTNHVEVTLTVAALSRAVHLAPDSSLEVPCGEGSWGGLASAVVVKRLETGETFNVTLGSPFAETITVVAGSGSSDWCWVVTALASSYFAAVGMGGLVAGGSVAIMSQTPRMIGRWGKGNP